MTYHSGAPMVMAPVSYVLFNKFMNFNPKNLHKLNRDRFVLSFVALRIAIDPAHDFTTISLKRELA